MAGSSHERSLREMEAIMLGQYLSVAREGLRVRKKIVEGKAELIDGLPDVLVERNIWSCVRNMYEVGKKSQVARNVLCSLNSKWRYLVSGYKEWAAYRLVNADFRDDSMNLTSIRLIDQQACCQTKLSAAIEMFQETSGFAGMSFLEPCQLSSYIEKEIHGCSKSHSGMRVRENEPSV